MRTAAIIGGGIGGLVLAGLLRRAGGWDVTVHERASALPASGTTLGIWPDAMAVLDRLGIGERLRAAATLQSRGRLCRPDGSTIARVDREPGAWLINRPELLAAVADASGKINFGSPIDDPGSAAGADLVVGADGVHSPTRAALTDAGVRRPGITIWRGVARTPCTELIETWAPGALFGMTPRPGGSTNWYATIATPPADAPAELPRLFRDWHPPVRAVIDAIADDTVLRHEALLAPPLRRYASGRIALIGDAAHAMAPNLGRGACETILDAGALADHLAGLPVPEALAAYDRDRRRAATGVQRASSVMARLAMARRALPARDLLARAAVRVG
ncbi:2-polyprenyl-6-methoxyphenol hydroxylase-like FAD-dependent oxidoreductase [Naumannella cuiyingiana]|uniref:2-polyprenyl-6-methoxyphenol hydroxylase-like FAD-dependent oxidoreductase n=1 Tax=Naumannella cuiyingiana TaxID=1347891 RepID=A0A7Z0D8Z9_9ACTN|nr:FAD-dependent monooxygenase [Naumannella cuiyingiana]NYI71153.1 2-polyprenyl-6-methoxyphenol hydroxylase-like FAD-dependent oxidoreductase [Naumannella cuiyingiana]